jgi:hypothetical protein
MAHLGGAIGRCSHSESKGELDSFQEEVPGQVPGDSLGFNFARFFLKSIDHVQPSPSCGQRCIFTLAGPRKLQSQATSHAPRLEGLIMVYNSPIFISFLDNQPWTPDQEGWVTWFHFWRAKRPRSQEDLRRDLQGTDR